jgi:hypothetical protein
MRLKPSPDVPPKLERRALMYHNRNREKAALYLARHAILAKGVCSDA